MTNRTQHKRMFKTQDFLWLIFMLMRQQVSFQQNDMEKNTEEYSRSGGEKPITCSTPLNSTDIANKALSWLINKPSWLFWLWQLHTLSKEKNLKPCHEKHQFPSAQANEISHQQAPDTGGVTFPVLT